MTRSAPPDTAVRALLPRQSARAFAILVVTTVVCFVLLVTMPHSMPYTVLTMLIVAAALFLRRGLYLVYSVVVAIGALWTGAVVADEKSATIPSVVTVLVMVPLMAFLLRTRFALGMPGDRPEHMLMELRQRLELQTDLPPLPPPWHVEAHLEPAYGQSFGGDFVVSAATEHGFEMALVDVSGNGFVAAARATQLTGAFGALIGSVPPRDFLARANEYVVRQRWEDGFATVLHVVVDLVSGTYSLGRAGHLPPLVRNGDTGRWSVLESATAPPLGVVAGAAFPRMQGLLRPGDALLMYSDGVVESRSLQHVDGTVRLLRAARGATEQGFVGIAGRIALAAPSRGEDRTVAILWRGSTAPSAQPPTSDD